MTAPANLAKIRNRKARFRILRTLNAYPVPRTLIHNPRAFAAASTGGFLGYRKPDLEWGLDKRREKVKAMRV